MPAFTYDALDAAGRAHRGTLEAPDRRAAARRLAAQGLRPTRLAEARARGAALPTPGEDAEDHPLLHQPRRLGAHPSAFAFVRGFADLHEGGMPVGDAIKLMAQRTSEPALRALCKGLWRDISEGLPLSAALAKRPAAFDESVIHLIAAGEETGSLVPVLKRIHASYEAREALRARIVGAAAYPLLLALGGTGVLAMFVFLIMPKMEAMMNAMGGKFPWYTKGAMLLAEYGLKSLPLLLVLGVFGFFSLQKARRHPAARRAQDAFLLKLPLLGTALLHAEAVRLAELLGTLLGSGVNAAQALKLAEKPLANEELRARFVEARRRVNDGAAISTALADTGLFQPEDVDLASVGENAGTLPRSFASMAERRLKALNATIDRIVKTFTTVLFGGVVSLTGFCLFSIISTVLSVSQSIGKR